MANLNFDSKQQEAVNMAIDFIKNKEKRRRLEFVLGGLAGTGKSSVIPSIIDSSGVKPDKILYCAFTGSVCNMLIAKGIPARTIHSALFACEKVKDEATGKYKFKTFRKDKGMIRDAYDLIVVDELSTVNDYLMETLRYYEIPMICMGDPGQFKAIGGSEISQSLLNSPDVFFKTVYRNGGYLLECAYLAREGDFSFLKQGRDKDNLAIISKYDTQTMDMLSVRTSQIICHSNADRIIYNDRVRMLRGFEGVAPNVGEKVICTDNNWDIQSETGILSLTNGLQGIVTEFRQDDLAREYATFKMSIRNIILKNEKFNNLYCDLIPFMRDYDTDSVFESERSMLFNIEIFNQFDFGYAITAYKGQGSQWRSGLGIGSKMDKDTLKRFYYTLMTRAEDYCFLAI